ncbi:MAG TPA: amino acid permease [Acidobacteriaceae bacterium]|jgi:L-asparagine transporter-like permease
MQSPQPQAFEDIAAREEGLKRTLSSRQLTMIAIGGAIGTGLFLGSGFAIGFAGPSVLISYLIGAAIALLLMACMAEMTVAHPVAGSFGAWAEFYVSPLAGFLVRIAYWAGVVFGLGTEISAIAVYMGFWFPNVPGWLWIVSFALVLVLVNATNVELFGTVEYGLSALKIAAVLAFLVLGAWLLFVRTHSNSTTDSLPIGFSNYTAFGGFFPKGLRGMWTAVLVALFSYFSIEAIAVAAAEARDPKVAIRRAFRATLARLVLFYVLTLAVVLALVPWNVTASGTAQSPFITVMVRTHIAHAAGVVNFVILIAALSAMNSQLYVSSRMLFSLARSGYTPRLLGTLSKRGVPVMALLASTFGIAVAAVLNARYHDRSFLIMLAVSIFGPMFAWLMIFVTHYRFRMRHRDADLPFVAWGFPYTTVAGMVLMLAALLTTWFARDFKPTLSYGIPFLLIMTLTYFAYKKSARTKAALSADEVPAA